jgi:hypothetical protein
MKILFLSILLLPVSLNSVAPQSEPLSPPEPLCSSGVAPNECKAVSGFLSFRQLGSPSARLVQFIIADDSAYKAEKQRVETMRNNLISSTTGKTRERALVAPSYLVSGLTETLFELKETNPGIVSKVYFNETEACHEASKTSKGDFEIYMCSGGLEYAFGFIDGVDLGTNNYRNFIVTAP